MSSPEVHLGQGAQLWLRRIARKQGGLNGQSEPAYVFRQLVMSLDPVVDLDAGLDGEGEQREVWVELLEAGSPVGLEGLSELEFLSPHDAEALGRALLAAAAASRGEFPGPPESSEKPSVSAEPPTGEEQQPEAE